MNKQEQKGASRVRVGGHKVVGSVSGEALYEALKDCVTRKSFTTINGATVDTFSASVAINVCDRLTLDNRRKLLEYPLPRLLDLCFTLYAKHGGG